MENAEPTLSGLGRALLEDKRAQIAEFAVLFLVPGIVIVVGLPLAGENLVALQGLVWVANVIMLLIVWLGLRLRGQGWDHFGLRFSVPARRSVLRAVMLSVVVLVAAVAAFIIGAIIGANIFGIPEQADMSEYNFLYNNLPLLLVSLVGVYIVSSFGEEVVYRGFLLTRIEELKPGGRHIRKVAVVISALIFGLAHYTWGPIGIVQTTFMGLALAIAYFAVGRNLWINVLAHAYMDTILFVQLYFTAPQSAGQ